MKTIDRLKVLLDEDGVMYNETLFDTKKGLAALGPNPFVSQNTALLIYTIIADIVAIAIIFMVTFTSINSGKSGREGGGAVYPHSSFYSQFSILLVICFTSELYYTYVLIYKKTCDSSVIQFCVCIFKISCMDSLKDCGI